MSIRKSLVERPYGKSGEIALRQAVKDHPGKPILLTKEPSVTIEDRRDTENANAGKVQVLLLIEAQDQDGAIADEVVYEVEYPSGRAKLINPGLRSG